MATLTRTKQASSSNAQEITIADSTVPSPFPTDVYQRTREQEELLEDLAREELDVDPFLDQPQKELVTNPEDSDTDGLCHMQPAELRESQEPESTEMAGNEESELLPSLMHLQQSCIMTLNNLLSGHAPTSSDWQPILPPRRHSLPSCPDSSPVQTSSPALRTLLTNLRSNYLNQMPVASSSSADDASMLGELQRRVDGLSQDLSPADARLARALISLLSRTSHLASIDNELMKNISSESNPSLHFSRQNVDVYDELSRQVMGLQNVRLEQGRGVDTPQHKAEMQDLWLKIDSELEMVSHLCRERNEPAPRPYSPGQLPPEYDPFDYEESDVLLPQYDNDGQSTYVVGEKEKTNIHSEITNEKMKMDFDAITMAIERLYLVAPQLHSQRVELRKNKIDELERARTMGSTLSQKTNQRAVKGKERERDIKELEKILDMVGKASSRRMDDQAVNLDPDMKTRIERSIQRDKDKRDEFVGQLLQHSSARRIASQDACFQYDKTRSPDTLLTLSEFILEQDPADIRKGLVQDPDKLMTLSEMVRESPPLSKGPKASPSTESLKPSKKNKSTDKRSRSLSAPTLNWLIPSLSRSSSSLKLAIGGTPSEADASKRLSVRYVAEHHETLNHVLVFIGLDEGMQPGIELEADVQPSVGDPTIGDRLILKYGLSISLPLCLPVSVTAGKASVQLQGTHYEIKLTAPPNGAADSRRDSFSNVSESHLLDASEISKLNPSSFVCACCSLPLVQAPLQADQSGFSYLDLPSEHWAELLEAWMCHSDQKLSERVARHSQGFWPNPGQAFIGGSYFLFDQSGVVKGNFRVVDLEKDDNWKRVQCICGAVVGRCQTHSMNTESESIAYRFPKYSVRPHKTSSPNLKQIPFSAFILEDMLELVRAHATYRFVILDEEEEKPRLLIWIFKPQIRLSYATTAQYVLPRSGSVNASKILFQILQPITDTPTGSLSSTPLSVNTPNKSPTPPSPPRVSFNTPNTPYVSTNSPRSNSPPHTPPQPKLGSSSQALNLDSILQRYPGFPQAERLLYPRSDCAKLMSLLKESNTAYPMGVRVMTGLLTGWFQRA